MCYSRSAVCLLTLSFALSATSLRSQTVELLNGSRSNWLGVASSYGACSIGPGGRLTWNADAGETVSNYVDANPSGTFLAKSGHEYRVLLAEGPVVSLADQSGHQTYWFWYGFAFVFCAGLVGLGARWVRQIIGGGGHNEGLNE